MEKNQELIDKFMTCKNNKEKRCKECGDNKTCKKLLEQILTTH